MAISRLWQSGAELGNTQLEAISSGGPAIVTSPYTGTYSFRDGTGYTDYWQVNFTATYALNIGFYFYGNTAAWKRRMWIRNGTTQLAEMRGQTDSSCEFYAPYTTYRGESTTGNTASWKHIGWSIYFNSSSGFISTWTNGVQDFSTTSINTGSTAANNIVFGHMESLGTVYAYFDDLYIDNITGEGSPVQPSPRRFYYVLPNGNGNYSQWVGSDSDSTDNYLLVDEIPPSGADYVESKTADEYDSYAMNTISLSSGQLVRAVIPTASVKRNGSTEQIAIGTRYSSTDSIGSDQTPSSSYALYRERQTTKPGGGDWDQTSIDGMELVIKSRGSY